MSCGHQGRQMSGTLKLERGQAAKQTPCVAPFVRESTLFLLFATSVCLLYCVLFIFMLLYVFYVSSGQNHIPNLVLAGTYSSCLFICHQPYAYAREMPTTARFYKMDKISGSLLKSPQFCFIIIYFYFFK